MSHQRNFFSTLFGSTDAADCCIVFYNDPIDSGHTGASPRALGEPLPAHQIILRAGSERFRAQTERWTSSIAGQAGTKRGRDEPNGAEEGPPRLRIRLTLEAEASPCPDTRDSSRRLPELKVHLNSEDELQPVMAAIRFMYTGSLREQQRQGQQRQQQQQQGLQQGRDVRGDSGRGTEGGAGPHVSHLVRVRRLADYLQVHGCAEACDEALAECFEEGPDGGSSSSTSSGSPLNPVLELYSCRHLLPSPEDDPRVRAVVTACRQYLVANWGAPLPVAPSDGTAQLQAPTKAEILAWLLGGGDAVRIANDPELRTAFLALPVGAVEELLQSDHLSTDDEATVVALVEAWVAAQGAAVTKEDKARVRRQLRLVNCNTAYLFDVLPKVPWLQPNPAQQAAFMARCRFNNRSHWQQHGGACGGYDTSSPWYGKPRQQSVPEEGVPYSWEVSKEDLLAGLRGAGADAKWIRAKILPNAGSCGAAASRVVAGGMEWGVQVKYKPGGAEAGLFLFCHAPGAVTAQAGRLQGGGIASSGLTVVGRSQKWNLNCTLVPYENGVGWPSALPLPLPAGAGQPQGQEQVERAGAAAAAGADAALLAPWATLLGPDGKIRGGLTFYRLDEGQE